MKLQFCLIEPFSLLMLIRLFSKNFRRKKTQVYHRNLGRPIKHSSLVRRIQDLFSVKFFCLPKHLRASSISVCRPSSRRLGRWGIFTLKSSSRRLQDVLENKKRLLGRSYLSISPNKQLSKGLDNPFKNKSHKKTQQRLENNFEDITLKKHFTPWRLTHCKIRLNFNDEKICNGIT